MNDESEISLIKFCRNIDLSYSTSKKGEETSVSAEIQHDLNDDKVGNSLECEENHQQCTSAQPRCTSLHDASNRGHVNCIQSLVASGTDVNFVNADDQRSPLMIAARKGHSDIVQMLIRAGADVNLVNDKKETALHYVCCSNNANLLRLILSEKAEVNCQDKDGSTAMILATKQNNSSLIAVLIQSSADVNLKDNLGRSALHWACFLNFIDCAEILVKDGGADLEDVDLQNSSPYVVAIKSNASAIVQLLIDGGCERNSIDGLMGTSLALAALKGHADVIDVLVRNYEDPDEYGYFGMTPLMLAAYESKVEAVDALIRADADVNIAGRMGSTVLHKSLIKVIPANEKRRHHIVVKLIQANANVNARLSSAGYFTSCTNGKNCPLSFAIASGYISLIRMLLIAGCDVSQSETSEWMELNNIRRFYNFAQLLNPILEWKSSPRSLMYSCRKVIRSVLPSRKTSECIDVLPIAEAMKSYLNFSDLEDIPIERAETPEGLVTNFMQQIQQVTPCGMDALEGTLLRQTVMENSG